MITAIESPAATFVGTVAGTLTTLSFLPQVVRVYQLRSARDLSYGYLLMFAGGVASWLIYGRLIGSLPVIATNAVTLTLLAAIIAMKARFAARPG